MVSLASIFWVLGFILSVVIAPQLRIWTWGPAMLCMALATGFSIFSIPKEQKNRSDLAVVLIGLALVAWLIGRAAFSEVKELADSDILLTCMAVSTFVVFRAVSRIPLALRILQVGLALITIASFYVASRQLVTPGYSLVFPNMSSPWVSGFYAHYSYGASFFLTVSLIFAGFVFQSGEKVVLRCGFGFLAIISAICVFYTKSRGGILGLAGGAVVLVIYLLILAKRENRRWFGVGILAIPLLIGGIVVTMMMSLEDAQETRGGLSSLAKLMDNDIRLFLYNIAVSCFMLHPIFGGGARSFSWEAFRFWDYDSMGQGTNKPEHVHNELLQTFVDYGLIGGFLLLIFLIVIVVVCTFRLVSESSKKGTHSMDGWRIGGLAGLAGLFVQSNFEGIFRIPPGAILLALCISAVCANSTSRKLPTDSRKPWFVMGVLSLVGISSALALGFWGIKGTRTTTILWDSYFGKIPPGNETKIDAASRAIEIWPHFSLYQHRALLYQELSFKNDDPEESRVLLKLSLADFEKASSEHPYDPTSSLGVATLQGVLGRQPEAEREFARAIRLQGGMDAGFKAHLGFARYLNKKGISLYRSGDFSEELVTFELAYNHIQKAYATSWWISRDPENLKLRIAIMQNYASALERSKQYRDAISLYELSATLPEGQSSHYRAAVLYGKLAIAAWADREGADALGLFLKAKQQLALSSVLPSDISPKKRDEWKAYFDQSIHYLEAAKFVPSEEIDF